MEFGRNAVLPETVWLAFICVLDAVLTVILVQEGLAVESNPLLAWSFNYGSVGFMATKILSFAPALAIIETLRPRLGDFAQLALRVGIIGYILLYVFGSIAIHA
ncbi:MAG TPA: DUF5658 family protein [Fimbriimonas sp.]